jgi:hypothetical protein
VGSPASLERCIIGRQVFDILIAERSRQQVHHRGPARFEILERLSQVGFRLACQCGIGRYSLASIAVASGGEQAVVFLGWRCGNAQRQRGLRFALGELLQVSRNQAVGREIDVKDVRAAVAARREKARARAVDLTPVVNELQAAGCESLRAIAVGLEEHGIPAARGGKWSAVQVARLLGSAGIPFDGSNGASVGAA